MKKLNKEQLNQVERTIEYLKENYPLKFKDNKYLGFEEDINNTIEMLNDYVPDNSIGDLIELTDMFHNEYGSECRTHYFEKFCNCLDSNKTISEQLLLNVSDEIIFLFFHILTDFNNGMIYQIGNDSDLEYHELERIAGEFPNIFDFNDKYHDSIKLSFDYDQIIKEQDYTRLSSGTIYNYFW